MEAVIRAGRDSRSSTAHAGRTLPGPREGTGHDELHERPPGQDTCLGADSKELECRSGRSGQSGGSLPDAPGVRRSRVQVRVAGAPGRAAAALPEFKLPTVMEPQQPGEGLRQGSGWRPWRRCVPASSAHTSADQVLDRGSSASQAASNAQVPHHSGGTVLEVVAHHLRKPGAPAGLGGACGGCRRCGPAPSPRR